MVEDFSNLANTNDATDQNHCHFVSITAFSCLCFSTGWLYSGGCFATLFPAGSILVDVMRRSSALHSSCQGVWWWRGTQSQVLLHAGMGYVLLLSSCC